MFEQKLKGNNADLALNDANKQINIKSIIEKWYILQKIIKEEETLEEVISKKQKIDFEQLKNYFKDYYKNKLEIRRILEEIKRIENNEENISKKINMERELEQIFLDISEPIKNLLFLFRTNCDYILTLISLINEYDEGEKISSLVELFCNQFYENILIKNTGTEELIILIFKLLEKEVNSMNFASIDEFLSDDSFLGKFMSSFLKRYELKHFLSSLINPFILNIDNSKDDDYCGMSLLKINEYIEQKFNEGSLKKEKFTNFKIENFLFENITKTSINFKKFDEENDNDFDDEDIIEQNIFESWSKKLKDEINNKNYNKDYQTMIDIDFLDDKICKEKDFELKNFYSYELEQIIFDPDIFSNKALLELFKDNELNENSQYIAKVYKENFLFLKNAIDYFIQLLIDQVEMIPYTLRCICKVISILLKEKFPSLLIYVRNSFIGKFIFDKCIFPVLCLENKNSLEPRILSKNTKKCLIDIVCILNQANKSVLFNNNIDCEKTIFNHYLIEIIPLLNKFYAKLIDVDLPPVLNNLLFKYKQNIGNNKPKDSFNIRKRKVTLEGKCKEQSKDENKPIYNYFNEHQEEIFNLQCICFSLDDILFILSLIGRNIKAFKHLPEYIFFERTYEFIQPSDYKLDQENSKHPDTKNFFIIFRDEKSSELENYMKERKNKKLEFNSEEKDPISVCKKFKFCIKKVLRGLKFLNRKDYDYLNLSIDSNNFFTALKFILEQHGEFSELKSRIPLKWYAQYIYNNKENLDDKYKYDDFSILYNEILNEESEVLQKLQSLISIIIIRNKMNLVCAESILETTKSELIHIKHMMECVRVEKFIDDEEIEVCIQTNELKNNMKVVEKKRSFTMTKLFKKDKEVEINESKQLKIPLLITDDLNCPHNANKINSIPENETIEKKIPYHAYNIKDLISKFSEIPWKEEILIKYEKPINLVTNDIANGNKNHQIYRSLSIYMDIVRKHLKEPTYGQHIVMENIDENQLQILAKIKDYIIRQIYKYIYPEKPLGDDFNFFNKVKRIQWITPEHLNLKNINIFHLNNAISWIKRFEFYKSINDKLYCINKIYIDMNNAIKFDYGINNEAKKEELKPLFQYIIIKAEPERMISNINYIKCFTENIELDEKVNYLLTLLESSKEFVINLTYKLLNITKQEFDKNMNNIKN